jgi:two-component system phosphate regulon response regulator PhoB
MTQLTTLILATRDPNLASVLEPLLPALDVIHAGGPQSIGSLRHGEIWCFIDWVLDDISGLELCRGFRRHQATAQAQVTMVLDDLDAETRRRALKAGADDYLLGPLSPGLVIDRLEGAGAALASTFPVQRLRAGALELDPNAHRVWFGDRPIPLQPRQFALLSFLMRHPDRVHSRGELLNSLGPGGAMADERTVDAWVARLRRELRRLGAPDPLRTVRDYGYVLDSK